MIGARKETSAAFVGGDGGTGHPPKKRVAKKILVGNGGTVHWGPIRSG